MLNWHKDILGAVKMKMPNARLNFKEAPPSALSRHDPTIKSAKASKSGEHTINIYSTVGEYGYGDGMTAKIVDSVLRKADGRDVTVNINSPGGDFFEGLAIYNLLKSYEGNVVINVLGMAASAASVVAMAGDEINIGKQAFIMIHNAWLVAIGNKHDLMDIADTLEQFDASMRDLYVEKTGQDPKAVTRMMDKETWIRGDDAIDQGFATALLGDDDIDFSDEEPQSKALQKIDIALAKSGMTRSERRSLLKELSGTPSAADIGKPSAAETELKDALSSLLTTLKKKD